MPLKVIGAGCERTGTYSLKLALEQLGFGPCHHMHELPGNPHLAPLWVRALNGEPNLWDEIFAKYTATTDAPGRLVYRELAEHYPEAKVILSVRDAERWVDSMFATIFNQNFDGAPPPHMMGFFDAMRSYSVRRFTADGGTMTDEMYSFPPSRDVMIRSFITHNDEVKRTIPPERLLVFEVKQGWEPLCAFLDVPVPDTPFPNENRTAEFENVVAKHSQKAGK